MQTRNLSLFLLILSVWMSLGFSPNPPLQSDQALQILESMTTAEKVGQLFLITFTDDAIDEGDQVYRLITEHKVSGVLLSKNAGSSHALPDSLSQLQEIITTLQRINYSPELFNGDEIGVEPTPRDDSYLPLFIGYKYEGGQQGTFSTLNSLSPLASNMAIGATWDEQLAFLSGEQLGRELEALGVNLLLGPALDVLEDPQTTGLADLGVRSFGGDPYWVSVMGASFISGLRDGSDGRIAIIASHFPGLGGSDRPIDEEVATVRKTLEELKQFDLAPFFHLTAPRPDYPNGLIQGLLTSHIRYQGFQGNIRATTRPISLDPQALGLVMSLEPLQTWRSSDGIMVSDSLGSRAIRLFRDPTGQSFNAHLVARDAFLAGNDLLLLENFRDSRDPDELTTIEATLDFFENKYEEDQIFAQRVDDAVLRIIRLKLSITGGSASFPASIGTSNDLGSIGGSNQLVNSIAQAAASLISPDQNQIDSQIDGIPRIGERIVFLTDVRYSKRCRDCTPEPLMAVDGLQRAVLKLFGPGAAGQVGSWNLLSYTFADLANYLGERSSESLYLPLVAEEDIDEAIRNADWLIFNMLDSRSSTFGANALQLFLDRRPDLVRDKKVVVFAYDVPYGLDATEISKIDLYYALYDSGQAFIDMAAKLLFQEQQASGAPSVNIPGLGYDLIAVTAPDPGQIIQLMIQHLEDSQATVIPEGFMIGDDVTIRTGTILDLNGNRVPDRTPVEFQIVSSAEGVLPVTIEASTIDGQASTTFTIGQAGLVTITASTGNARISETLQIDARLDEAAQAVVISPTLMPTVTSEPTLTPVSPTSVPEGETGETGAIKGSFASRLGALVLGLVALAVASGLGYLTAKRAKTKEEVLLRFTLLPALGGLCAYNYLALGLPGSQGMTTVLGGLGVFAGVSIGGVTGLLVAYLWDRFSSHEGGEEGKDEKEGS